MWMWCLGVLIFACFHAFPAFLQSNCFGVKVTRLRWCDSIFFSVPTLEITSGTLVFLSLSENSGRCSRFLFSGLNLPILCCSFMALWGESAICFTVRFPCMSRTDGVFFVCFFYLFWKSGWDFQVLFYDFKHWSAENIDLVFLETAQSSVFVF